MIIVLARSPLEGTSRNIVKTITFTKAGVDVAFAANDMPTTNDVALSKLTGYDCKLTRIKDGLEAVCKTYKMDQHPSEKEDDE